MMRRAPSPNDVGTTRLASQSRARKKNLSQEASAQIRQSIESKMAQTTPASQAAGAIATDGGGAAPSADLAASSQVHFHATGETAANAVEVSKTEADTDATLQVAFAWTEVSREWLQAMGATDPGLHRVADLEGRLRDSKGAYRILEVSKQKIESGVSSFGVRRGDRDGDRTALKVEIASVSDNGFAGSIQMSYRGSDGGLRVPSAAALSIDKGQGSILTFPAAPPTPGVAPPALTPTAEIVVLILPRWGADRNP